MMNRSQRRTVWILMAVIFLASAALSEALRPGHNEYQRAALAKSPEDFRDTTGSKSALGGTPFQTLLPTLLGVREVMASLMWVQADEYFHRGEYRPIISMVRQITAIDPHQLDVYATGAWHMAYNFMDKRLIEDGVKFLEDGCKNNSSVYDLYFELGYMHYDKTKDFGRAITAYQDSSQRGTTTGKTQPPSYVRHQLAHAMEKSGNLDQCLQQWDTNVETANRLIQGGEANIGPSGVNLAAAQHNRYMTDRRINERLAALAERQADRTEAIRLWQANVQLQQDWLKQFPGHPDVTKDLAVSMANVRRLQSGKLNPLEPADPELKFMVRRIAPRKLQVEGTASLLNYAKLHVRFRDKDYESRIQKGFDFKMNECTLEWDNATVNNGKFKTLIDLGRDPADMGREPEQIYPLKADQYEMTVTYNPRVQPAFIQDRYGWNGEGLTASPDALKIDPQKPGIIRGKSYPLRTVTQTVTLDRADVVGDGAKVLASR
ncbi:MAG TPA: hypothetical protein VK689_23370 [Armatimonadota bacterium]|nr:hypothetical protein [Armatimonadota bacterium]